MRSQFGSFSIDFDRERVTLAGNELRLRRQCWELLAFLARRGDVVSKEEISAHLWPDVAVEPNTLNVVMWELRRSLATNGAVNAIESVGRRGYRLRSDDVSRLDSSAPTPDPRGLPDLIGRTAELEYLRSALRLALNGSRQVVFVTGEAGIGKSFLLASFARELAAIDEFRCARGHCLPLQAASEPYAVVLEVIESMTSDAAVLAALHQHAPAWLVQMPALLPPEEMQHLRLSLAGIGAGRLLREVVRLLEHLSERWPIAIFLEDIQWADDESLDVLESLVARPQPARLFALASIRSYDLGERETEVRNKIYGLARRYPAASRLDLQPLNRDAVRQFVGVVCAPPVAAQDALVGALEEASGGNPLFLATLADALEGESRSEWIAAEPVAWDIPRSLRDVISERLDRLPGTTIPLVEAASVVGLEFTAAEVAAALQTNPDDVERNLSSLARMEQFILAAAEQSWPDGTRTGGYRFRHLLYQRAIYQRCATVLRRTYHERIGRRLGEAYRDRVASIVSRLTHHFEAAGDLEALATYQEVATAVAFSRYAAKEAIAHFECTLRTLQALPASARRDEREARCQLEYANLLIWHEGFSSARAGSALDRVSELAGALDLPEVLVRAQLAQSFRCLMTGAVERAIEIADEMVRLAEARAPQMMASAYLYAGNTRLPSDVSAAVASHQRALDVCDQLGHSAMVIDLRAMISSAQAIALSLAGREPEAMMAAEVAYARVQANTSPGQFTSIASFCACAALLAGAAPHAERFAGVAAENAKENDISIYHHVLEICLLWARHVQTNGDLAELESAIARRAASPEHWYQGLFELKLAECFLAAGDLEKAERWIDSSFALDERFVRAEMWRVRGELAHLRGEREAASEHFGRAGQLARAQGALTFERRAAASAMAALQSAEAQLRHE